MAEGHGVGGNWGLSYQRAFQHFSLVFRESVGDDTCINPARLMLKLGPVHNECVVMTFIVQVAHVFGLTFVERPPRLSIIDAATATTWDLVDIRVRESVWWAAYGDEVAKFRPARSCDSHLTSYDSL